MNIFFSGTFGRQAAQLAGSLCSNARLIDMDEADAVAIAGQCRGGFAMVLLSEASRPSMAALAVGFRAAGVVWTAVHLYPAMIRIGPLVRADGVCFDCATRRYLSSPGSDGLARLEELLRGSSSARPIAFPVVPATVTAMAVAEALHQLDDLQMPAGFIRKVDFVEHSMSAAVAQPLHGCDCGDPLSKNRARGERFYSDLENDMLELTGGVSR